MKISIRFSSHIPVLMKLVKETNGPILELGIGPSSTPYLYWTCFPNKRKLVSYENSEGYIRYFKDTKSDFHELNLISDWDKLDTGGTWDIVFVDHSPDERRYIEARRFAQTARYVVLHDSNPENDGLYKYSEIYPLFKYRFDYKDAHPNTTVLSNFVDLSNFTIP
jgi:hypothetical protein